MRRPSGPLKQRNTPMAEPAIDPLSRFRPKPAPDPFGAVGRIPVQVQIVLGETTMAVADLVALGRGAVVALDRRIGEPVDIVVNGRVVARGDLRILEGEGERFGVAVTEIVGRDGADAPT